MRGKDELRGHVMVPARGSKCWRVRERECLREGRMVSKNAVLVRFGSS